MSDSVGTLVPLYLQGLTNLALPESYNKITNEYYTYLLKRFYILYLKGNWTKGVFFIIIWRPLELFYLV